GRIGAARGGCGGTGAGWGGTAGGRRPRGRAGWVRHLGKASSISKCRESCPRTAVWYSKTASMLGKRRTERGDLRVAECTRRSRLRRDAVEAMERPIDDVHVARHARRPQPVGVGDVFVVEE